VNHLRHSRIREFRLRLRQTRLGSFIASLRARRTPEEDLVAATLERAKGIPTFTTQEELHALRLLAMQCPEGAYALEIGSYLGASTCYLAASLVRRKGKLICVDTWANETMPEGTRDTFAEFQRNTAGVSSIITTLRKRSDSIEAAELPSSIALAFIDGDHSYDAVKGDVKLLAPRLAEDGVLAFHDIYHFEGVSRVVGELLMSGNWKSAGQISNLIWLKKQPFTQ
jgi:predicted O-methyltransferase YrrM